MKSKSNSSGMKMRLTDLLASPMLKVSDGWHNWTKFPAHPPKDEGLDDMVFQSCSGGTPCPCKDRPGRVSV